MSPDRFWMGTYCEHAAFVSPARSPLSEVADALDLARRISRAAPLRRASARLRPHTVSDVFKDLEKVTPPSVRAWRAERLEATGTTPTAKTRVMP
ncbi:hypothetical protein [Streptomyces chartreusis]|uniref:hypothetical protein n=1 Tax=Streptomyces chartreusis TaxID=1969 RepID=UPI003F53FCB8